MQAQPTEQADGGICVAHGYGLKLYIHHGHLIVHDGIGRQRRTRRYHRATSRLRRLVVIGHTGFVSLDALLWIQEAGAAFVQIDSDGNLLALSAPARHHESKLRRAQVLAPENGLGEIALVTLLRAKLEAQSRIAQRLAHLKPTVRVKDTRPVTVAELIREHARALHPELGIPRLRQIESAAGRAYWQTWARLPIQFEASWQRQVPEHWASQDLERRRLRTNGVPAKRPAPRTRSSTTATRSLKPKPRSPATQWASTPASGSCIATSDTAVHSRPTSWSQHDQPSTHSYSTYWSRTPSAAAIFMRRGRVFAASDHRWPASSPPTARHFVPQWRRTQSSSPERSAAQRAIQRR